jgi:hypothetical protein
MGRVGRCQGQAHPYSVGLAKEGLSFSFLDSRRPCSLVLKVGVAPFEWTHYVLFKGEEI